MIFIVSVACVCAIAGGIIGSQKGEAGGGFLMGLLLGPIGLVVAIAWKPDRRIMERKQLRQGMKKCPACAEIIQAQAAVCRYCQHRFEPDHAGVWE